MSTCEKCWSDAYLRHRFDPRKSQADHYHDLLEERRNNPCTAEQQLGIPDHQPGHQPPRRKR